MAEPSPSAAPAPHPAAIPKSFLDYLGAMGPGIVVVLTWLGAGDIVDSAVAGGSYGYALMWVMALALVIRWLFVSTIAKYQLCNQHGETVMQGLKRLHPFFPPFILVSAVILGHIITAYMYQGVGESCRALAGFGPSWVWALGWAVVFYLLLARPVFRRIEFVFMVFLGLLGISMVGSALWVGPNPVGIIRGTIGFQMPEQRGDFDPVLISVSLIGAVAGSLANLMYPYFIREKGWLTPAHRKVQLYDLALGVLVIIVLDLSVWALGAEVLHPNGLKVGSIQGIAAILSHTLGETGRILFYLGVFAAVGSSVVGNAYAYSHMATDAFILWRPTEAERCGGDYRLHPGYRWMTLWVLFSPLVWVIWGKVSFVALTIAVNAFQVLLLPILAAAMWVLTSSNCYIGGKYRNRWWENAGMAVFLIMAVLGAVGAVQSLAGKLLGGS
jgi:Mn2+/Fe2+ NRAMP family transporter